MFEERICSISEMGGMTYCQNMFAIDQFKQIVILSLLYPLYPRSSGLLLFSEKVPSVTDTTLAESVISQKSLDSSYCWNFVFCHLGSHGMANFL